MYISRIKCIKLNEKDILLDIINSLIQAIMLK